MTITIERFVEKLEKLKTEMDAGALKHGEYDMRLARIITELRQEKLEADRDKLGSTIDALLERGVITPSVKTHLRIRLGLD